MRTKKSLSIEGDINGLEVPYLGVIDFDENLESSIGDRSKQADREW